jgi:hypothetical protein
VPGRGSLDPADHIENTSSFDGAGRADTHDLYLRIRLIFDSIYLLRLKMLQASDAGWNIANGTYKFQRAQRRPI